MKSITEYYDQLRENFTYHTGVAPQGSLEGMLMAFATARYQIAIETDTVKKQQFALTCDEKALFMHAGIHFDYIIGRKATGYVIFYGEVGQKVPKGTVISDDVSSYVTTAEGEVKEYELDHVVDSVVDGNVFVKTDSSLPSSKALVNGTEVNIFVQGDLIGFTMSGLSTGDAVKIITYRTLNVPVECKKVGLEGNRNFNAILTTDEVLDVDSTCRAIYNRNGLNEETTEEYRSRYIEHLRRPQIPFAKADIEHHLLKSSPFLKKVWFKQVGDDAHIVGANEKGELKDFELDHLKKLIEIIRPAWISKDNIKIAPPNKKEITLTIKKLHPNYPDLKENITANLKSFFGDFIYQEVVTQPQVTQIIMNTYRGEQKPDNFTIDFDFDQLAEQENTIFILKDVLFID